MATSNIRKNGLAYLLVYLFIWLSGLLIYLTLGQSDQRLKFHSVQAIFLGIIIFILSFITVVGAIIAILLWIYGLYIGWAAANGEEIEIPLIGEYARKYSK